MAFGTLIAEFSRMRLSIACCIAPLLFAAACASEVQGSDSGGPPPEANAVIGSFEVTSNYNLAQSADVPSVIANALGPLSGLSENPAEALIELLKNANSDVANVIDSLPSGVKQVVIDELNSFLAGQPEVTEVIGYVDMVATMLTNFQVITTLEVGRVDEAGNSKAIHSLKAVSFPIDGQTQIIATPDVLNLLSTARDVSVNVDLANARILFGDHQFHLPLGNLAVTAYHSVLESQLGTADLGDYLVSKVNCEGLAAQVGDVCYDSICVLNEEQIAGFCVDALEKVAEEVDAKVAELEFADLHMTGGEASYAMDGAAVGTMQGNWDTEFGVNSQGFTVPSSFTATRN